MRLHPRTEAAKDYTRGHRLYGLVEGRLLWTYDMEAVGQPLLNHLAATLVPADAVDLPEAGDGA